MAYYIGIDLGTSSVKVVLTDGKGEVLTEAAKEYKLEQPAPGWKEIEAQTWWKATSEAVRELLARADSAGTEAKSPDRESSQAEQDRTSRDIVGVQVGGKGTKVGGIGSQIRGIGVTGQMHSLVLLDESGEPVRPVLMWNDTRTAALLPELQERIAASEVSYINTILSTGSPAANLYWVKKEEPGNFMRIKKFLIGPDYLVYRLTGTYGTDFCEASTSSLYDLTKKRWSPEMLEIVGASPEICPEVKGSAQIAGTLLPEVAAEFGVSPEAVVLVGTGDNPAASIPTGCLGKGDTVLSLGTSGVLMFPREEPDFEAKGKNILFSFDGKSMNTLTQGVVQSCGSGYNWLIREILKTDDFGAADREIDPTQLGAKALLFYPHLVGDKTIYRDASLRGAYLGLGTETTQADLIQAFMEGVAFAVRQLVEEMALPREKVQNLKVIGGGSKSRIWMQILADVLDTTTWQMEGNAGAGYGMALLAAYVCGEIGSLEGIAEKAVRVKAQFAPDTGAVQRYQDGYQKYLRIHDAMKTVFG